MSKKNVVWKDFVEPFEARRTNRSAVLIAGPVQVHDVGHVSFTSALIFFSFQNFNSIYLIRISVLGTFL